jgi:hypothetical protein
MTFYATAGTRVSMTTSMSGTWTSSILDSAGNTVAFCTPGCDNGSNFIEPINLTKNDTYKVTLTSDIAGNGTITLYNVTDQNLTAGDPTPVNGTAVPINIKAAGQTVVITFHGTANHTLSMTQTGNVGQFATTLYDPSGYTLAQCGSGCDAGANFLEPLLLTSSGTYKIVFDPKYNSMGTETLTLYDVPPDIVVNVATPTASGVAVPLATTTPGQNAHIYFSDTAGRRLSWTQDGSVGVFGTGLSWIDPTGQPPRQVAECGWNCGGGSKFLEPVPLPLDGTYRVDFYPSYYYAGTETITLYDVVDVTGSLTIGGPSLNVNLPTPGQRALLTFDAAGGQAIVTVPSNDTIVGGLALLGPAPTNGYLGGSHLDQSMNFTLPPQPGGNGTYTVLIDPSYQNTGSVTIKVQGAPAAKDLPQITGQAQVGAILTATGPSWAGVASGTLDQWQRCDAQGLNCVATGITSSSTYGPLSSADLGKSLRVVASASNTYGTGTATSLPTPDIIDENALQSLAFRYRPWLLFDSQEPYRPITLDSLLSERDSKNKPVHQRCDLVPATTQAGQELLCNPAGSMSAFLTNPRLNSRDGWPPLWSYLKIWSQSGTTTADGNEVDYHTPSPKWPCGSNAYSVAYRDCGDAPAEYYDFGQGTHFYRFLDYWFFYRYNNFQTLGFDDDHEGDWEGVTVVLKPQPGLQSKNAVAGAIFWGHGKGTFRLASAIAWCIPNGAVGSNNWSNCALTNDSSSLGAFVAKGSHASYAQSCLSPCSNELGLPEGRSDGNVGWDDNYDARCTQDQCVKPMMYIDGTATLPWVYWPNPSTGPSWPGSWGGDETGLAYGNSPKSPGQQTAYSCTQAGWNCGASLTADSDPFPTPLSLAQTSAQTHAFSLSLCRNWYDARLAAYACSASRLRATVDAGRLGSAGGDFNLIVRGRQGAATAGLVQVGGQPLRPGMAIRFAGTPPSDSVVIVNVRYSRVEYAVELRHVRLHVGARLKFIVQNRRPVARLVGMTADVSVRRLSRR